MEQLRQMREEDYTTEKDDLEGGGIVAIQPQSEGLPSTEFVKVEKNLATLGFFTPSSKRLRNAQEKSFTITTIVEGKRLEMKGTIIPSAKYGLPITADQDKWIALCNILTDVLQKEGKVTNPISFTSADILRILNKHRHSGKNYKEVEEWLDVLFSTTIFSEGVIYLANEKRRAKDRFRVLERAVTLGKELPNGKVADKNYVWFSDWQLQNINNNHLLPIDIEAYRQLKNHIAKALVLQLQVWLYATREEGVFEKRYDELCQILNIQQYRYLSLIKRTLAPSLDELTQFGYLADWKLEETSDGQNYKIIFFHGEKFHRDRRARLARKHEAGKLLEQPSGSSPFKSDGTAFEKPRRPYQRRLKLEPVAPEPTFNPQVVAEFTRRSITENKTRELLANLKPGQDVLTQLEWGDHQIHQARGKITNPAGFYISLVSANVIPPPTFETSAQRKTREERERRQAEERLREQELENEYFEYCSMETDRYIAALDPAAVEAVQKEKRKEMEANYTSSWIIESSVKHETRRELAKRVPLMTIDEFKARRGQGTGVSPEPAAEVSSVTGNREPQTPEPNDIQSAQAEAVGPAIVAEERGAVIELPPKAATHPEIPEPAVELVSEPPSQEPTDDSIEPPLP